MAVRSFPLESQPANEADYYLMHRETGVLEGLNLTLNGLNWGLSPGAVYTSGTLVVNDGAGISGTVTPTSGALPRRDMLCARRTLLPGGGSFGMIALKQGTPAASPVDPALATVIDGVFEEPLFSWQVAASGAATTTAIRDLRRSAAWWRGTATSAPVAVGLTPLPGWVLHNAMVRTDPISGRHQLSGAIQPVNSFNPQVGTHVLAIVPSGHRPNVPSGKLPPFFRVPNTMYGVDVDIDIRANGDLVLVRGPNQIIPNFTWFDLNGIGFY